VARRRISVVEWVNLIPWLTLNQGQPWDQVDPFYSQYYDNILTWKYPPLTYWSVVLYATKHQYSVYKHQSILFRKC